MIIIFGTLVQNDDISRRVFHFFKISIFWVVGGVKGQKVVQNDKKILSVVLHISGAIHYIIVIYGALVYLQGFFSFIKNFDFLGC